MYTIDNMGGEYKYTGLEGIMEEGSNDLIGTS